jgi:hypothetical protein
MWWLKAKVPTLSSKEEPQTRASNVAAIIHLSPGLTPSFCSAVMSFLTRMVQSEWLSAERRKQAGKQPEKANSKRRSRGVFQTCVAKCLQLAAGHIGAEQRTAVVHLFVNNTGVRHPQST